jgi:hypothetical protein
MPFPEGGADGGCAPSNGVDSVRRISTDSDSLDGCGLRLRREVIRSLLFSSPLSSLADIIVVAVRPLARSSTNLNPDAFLSP